MAVTIIVEDGSIVAGANSFMSLAEARAAVEQYGLTLAADDDTASAQLTQAYHQLKRSYQSRLKGSLVSQEQTGIFPRDNVEANGFTVASDSIPGDVINAQLAYADSINRGADMNQTASAQEVQSKSLDGVGSTTYKAGSSKRTTPLVPAVTQWLQPYMQGVTLNREDAFYVGE